MSNYAAPGPDGFPAMLLKMCKLELSYPLELIFKESLKTGDIPEIFKSAFVFPLHKGGMRSEPANYRPVSLTSHLVKTFERVLKKHLVRYLEFNEKINNNQHGFRNGRSCLTQLLQQYDRILSILEEGKNADAIYLDFSKAFDKVDKGILLRKLKRAGISGNLGRWIQSFLTGRSQQVIVNSTKSSPSLVTSGVPQGSVLGPLLFLILINDIDQGISANVSLFADDTRILSEISSENCVENFQQELEKLYQWEENNNMKFNGGKFELIRFGSNKEIKEDTLYFTPKHESIIEEKESLRDLGIIISNDMTFSKHVEKVSSKVCQKAGWILRTFKCRKTFFLKLLFKSLLQPHIDYCSQLYFPAKQNDMEKIENLQKNFFNKIPEVQHLNYWEKLKFLKMNSQERRMERYRILYVWKILEKKAMNCGLESYINDRRGRLCRIPQLNLHSRTSVQSLREASFQVHGPRLFNKLPKNIRNLTNCSVDDFKSKLDQFLENIPDEPRVSNLVPTASSQVTARASNSLLEQIKTADQITGG